MPLTERPATVSSSAARDVYLACKKLALLTPEEENELQLSEGIFESPEHRLPETTLIALWRRLAQQDLEPDIALTIGQTIAPESKGLLASWVSQANTLAEALEVFFENIALMNPSESWVIHHKGSQTILELDHTRLSAYPAGASERSMAAMVSWARVLSANPFPIIQASFVFPEPAYTEVFESIFGENVLFNAKANTLNFERQLLDLPITSSNHLLKSLMEDKAKTALAQLSEQSTAKKVEVLIQHALNEGETITIEQTCKVLAKSRQTLYRQLKQDGTDFQTLYNQARKAHALRLLGQPYANISTISLQLGFKDSSSFYKAFRRWTGMTPSAYIEQTKQP